VKIEFGEAAPHVLIISFT